MAHESTPVKRLRRLLTSENLWIYMLSCIKKSGKEYAYALPEKIEKRFGFRPGKIMAYVVLYRLEGEGLITSQYENRRNYYTLTKKGREALTEAKKQLSAVARGI
jgi:PadR family transcriptional regulator, regulatory protein PadR